MIGPSPTQINNFGKHWTKPKTNLDWFELGNCIVLAIVPSCLGQPLCRSREGGGGGEDDDIWRQLQGEEGDSDLFEEELNK